METSIGYTDREFAYISSDQYKWVRRVRSLKESHPDNVTILMEPEKNDGCIYARFPADWVRVSPPRKINMTDEKKRELSERMRNVRNTASVLKKDG